MLMSMMAWRSGRRAGRPTLRFLPIIVAAFTISAAFGVASIFSSNVTSETLNQVLLKGTRCGAYSEEKANSIYKQLTLLLPSQSEKASKFLNYGMQCYTNETHADGCNLYIKPKLPLVSTRGLACPYGDNICTLENDNLVMDTGLLDSLEHLGINTAPEHRFQLRFLHTCAPLKTKGYTSDYNDSDYGAVKRYHYGDIANFHQVNNWTFELPVDNAYIPGDNTSSADIPRLEYSLGTQHHYSTPNETLLPGANTWSPIDALKRDDADVYLLFMSADGIHYAGPTDDPWFSAHKNASEIHYQKTKDQFDAWLQDEPLGVMACTQQVQYCNPSLPEGERCEPLRGGADPRKAENVKKIFPTDDHFSVIEWVDNIWVYGVYTISATVGFIGASALRARYGLSYGYSAPLPDDQWQLEAEHWIKGTLASLQDVFVEAANGIPEALEDFRQPPLADETVAQNLCVNQKIVSTNYSSFNVLGLSLILIIGVIVVVLDMGLEPTVAWWQRRTYAKHQARDEGYPSDKIAHPLYAALEWNQTSILQLQRHAQEEAGFGEWTRCATDVPVTEPRQLLAGLDLRRIAHPLLTLKHGTPASEWSGENVIAFKPWGGVRRSDTGLDTLVEEAAAEVEKEGKKVEGEKGDTEVFVGDHNGYGPDDREEARGLGVHLHDRTMEDQQPGQEWRVLK
ncbi:hypothetical protein N0V83_007643 [Neocucurbitaria cava]|uniref:Uncharacterized protein n=1 Tax=Neocucurbitaria cava TaxID=798079 RepID=A0A9W8Y484_9PLEO|nr:hypothetical protein N0V83_007643 [Neocucurbitaria cava]